MRRLPLDLMTWRRASRAQELPSGVRSVPATASGDEHEPPKGRKVHGRVFRTAATAAPVAVLVLLGCRGMPSPYPPIHLNPNMDYQERYDPQEASAFFYDGMAMRQPVAGTVARGQLQTDHRLLDGRDDEGYFLETSPIPVSDDLLVRGRRQYEIYCQPCHDERGTGQGILFERAATPTASLHDELRTGYSDGRLYDIITEGSGLMAGYRYPLGVEDRWAVVAYVRELQEERRTMQAEREARQ